MENTNIGCGTCCDLLPLYTDGVTSNESNALVETHLVDCEDCRAELERQKAILPIPSKSPKKAMRTVKQKLRTRRILIGVGSGLGAAALLFGLFLFLINYMIPVTIEPDDLVVNIDDGVFMMTSQKVDSLFTSGYCSHYELEDGTVAHTVIFFMQNPLISKLWPALCRKVYPPMDAYSAEGYRFQWHPEHGMQMLFGFGDSDADNAGIWRVYLVRESDYRKRGITEDPTTGKLTEESMPYATLVWEETIS